MTNINVIIYLSKTTISVQYLGQIQAYVALYYRALSSNWIWKPKNSTEELRTINYSPDRSVQTQKITYHNLCSYLEGRCVFLVWHSRSSLEVGEIGINKASYIKGSPSILTCQEWTVYKNSCALGLLCLYINDEMKIFVWKIYKLIPCCE